MNAIELGGGNYPQIHPNLDCRKLDNVDIVADFEKPLPLPNDEYDFVLSKFVLEHIGWRHAQDFICEIYRILKPNGRVIITTANLLEQAKQITSKLTWDGTESNLIFGGQDHEGNFHKCGFSPQYLEKCFRDAGFSKVITAPLLGCPTDMWLEATK